MKVSFDFEGDKIYCLNCPLCDGHAAWEDEIYDGFYCRLTGEDLDDIKEQDYYRHEECPLKIE